jgi:hypothetical protein
MTLDHPHGDLKIVTSSLLRPMKSKADTLRLSLAISFGFWVSLGRGIFVP